jgi:hypothetical protein
LLQKEKISIRFNKFGSSSIHLKVRVSGKLKQYEKDISLPKWSTIQCPVTWVSSLPRANSPAYFGTTSMSAFIPVFFIEQSIAFKTSKKVGKQKEIFFHHLLKKMAKYQNGNSKNGKTAKGNIYLKNRFHNISFKTARLSQHFIFTVTCDRPNKLDCSQHSDTQLTTHTHLQHSAQKILIIT